MQQEKRTENGNDDNHHEQQGNEIPPIQRPTVAAICIWFFVFFSVFFWLFLRKQIPVQSEYIKIAIESMFSLALVILVIVQTRIYFTQTKVMERQWRGSLAAVRPIVEIVIWFEPPKGIVFTLRNIGKSRASVQFSYEITLGNRIVLSGEIPEFEIDISGQQGHGEWRRAFTTSMTDDEATEANGPIDQR
jgi:hypothetical protein